MKRQARTGLPCVDHLRLYRLLSIPTVSRYTNHSWFTSSHRACKYFIRGTSFLDVLLAGSASREALGAYVVFLALISLLWNIPEERTVISHGSFFRASSANVCTSSRSLSIFGWRTVFIFATMRGIRSRLIMPTSIPTGQIIQKAIIAGMHARQ